MKRPRFRLSGILILVAIVAVDLAIFKSLYDGTEEDQIIISVPTVNILVFGGILSFRRSRPFAVGFVVAGAISLLGFNVWINENPWTFLHLFTPPLEAAERRLEILFPMLHDMILYGLAVVAFAIPHTIVGLAGGWLTARGWAKMNVPRAGVGG